MKYLSKVFSIFLSVTFIFTSSVFAAPQNGSLTIDNGVVKTSDPNVSLDLQVDYATEMKVSNVGFNPIPIQPDWTLDGSGNDTDIYIDFDTDNVAQT